MANGGSFPGRLWSIVRCTASHWPAPWRGRGNALVGIERSRKRECSLGAAESPYQERAIALSPARPGGATVAPRSTSYWPAGVHDNRKVGRIGLQQSKASA